MNGILHLETFTFVYVKLEQSGVQSSFNNFTLLFYFHMLTSTVPSFLSSALPLTILIFPSPFVLWFSLLCTLFWCYYSIQLYFYSILPVLVENSSRSVWRILWSQTALSIFTMDTLYLPDIGVSNPKPLISASALHIIHHTIQQIVKAILDILCF